MASLSVGRYSQYVLEPTNPVNLYPSETPRYDCHTVRICFSPLERRAAPCKSTSPLGANDLNAPSRCRVGGRHWLPGRRLVHELRERKARALLRRKWQRAEGAALRRQRSVRRHTTAV